ncbi:unnamed protein product [Gongylonema pulchrum]|uniref:Transposase n=1 Tax=Gongylonema pulchrum TaxID=637853 RepID=A0A183D8F8_9BILA|nr:unnamed protein product [Gongylonema pulchrum]
MKSQHQAIETFVSLKAMTGQIYRYVFRPTEDALIPRVLLVDGMQKGADSGYNPVHRPNHHRHRARKLP